MYGMEELRPLDSVGQVFLLPIRLLEKSDISYIRELVISFYFGVWEGSCKIDISSI